MPEAAILRLPGEVLHLILVQSALCRGVKRALRLRLVCKTFDKVIYYRALFESHLLDHEHVKRYNSRTAVYLCNSNDHGVAKLWHNYLVYRVIGERDIAIGRFVEIRSLAQAIVQADPSKGLRSVVDSLCWLALDNGAMAPSLYENWRRAGANDLEFGNLNMTQHPEPRLNLLAAATLFDMMPLVSELLAEGRSPTRHNNLLPPAIQVAAQSGNTAMLELFLGHSSVSGFEPYSVYGAAVRGDLEIMKLVLPADGGHKGQHNGYGRTIQTLGIPSKTLKQARRVTLNPKVYGYLSNAWAPGPRNGRAPSYADLASHAGRGNMDMVKYLLAQGVPVDGTNTEELESALEQACRRGHDDIVDLLMKRGADPEFTGHALWGAVPMRMAASAGHISIVRKLMDHGAKIENHGGGPGCGSNASALHWAFLAEHTQMAALLMERGASIREGDALATTLAHLDYESMLEVVREHGFEPDVHKYGLRIDWDWWPEQKNVETKVFQS
ncbi:hypothetical protein PG987_015759 [Apiospora arundinis]